MAYSLITVNAGHSAKAPGAAGCGYKEHEVARILKDKLINALRSVGQAVVDTTSDAATKDTVLAEQVKKCNAQNKNGRLDISIHLNATPGGFGTEVYYYSEKELAAKVSAAIAQAGCFKDRGVKDGKHLYFLKNTNAPAILIEVCFIDSADDMQKLYANLDSIINKAVTVLTGQVVSATQPAIVEPNFYHSTTGPVAKVRVIADNVNIYSAPDFNSAVVRKALKGEEFDVYINQNDWHNVGGAHWIKGNQNGVQQLALIGFRVIVDNLQYGQARDLVPELQKRFGGNDVWGEPK